MNNKRFFIKGLGEFEYVVTLLSVDYPETFVARKVGEECELFIFDEVKSDANSITWISCHISLDEFYGLNKGTVTLNSCFMGPRKTKKAGYLVTSQSEKEEAEYILIEDVAPYLADNDVYVPQFIEDSHGSNILSLATGKVLFSVVVDEKEYSNPFFNINKLTNNTNDGKAFLKSLPFNIEVKNNRACIQTNRSIVINFEISDKQVVDVNTKQMRIEQIEEESKNVESLAALRAIEEALNSGDSKEKLISALGNSKRAVDKYRKFVSTISKNKAPRQIVQMVGPNGLQASRIELNKEKASNMAKVADESIFVMDSKNKKNGTIHKSGYFEMFDLKGKFRFIGDDGVIYRGIKSLSFDKNTCPIEIKDSDYRYVIEMKSISYEFDGKSTDFSYELVSVTKEPRPIQAELELR